MQIDVIKVLKESGSRFSHTFKPKPDELAIEDVEFSKKPIRVSVDLENVGEGIVGSIEVDCELKMECGRCVERFNYAVSVVRQIEYLQTLAPDALKAELDGWFVSQYDGETIVLDEDVRQMLILALPMRFLCNEDCRGRCARCGSNLNAGPCACPGPGSAADLENPFRRAFDDLKRKKKI